MDVPKQHRLAVFLERLAAAPAAGSAEEAFELIARTLNEVEDELTSIPYLPASWLTDGRMYPPQPDSLRDDPLPEVDRYRSRGHYTRIHVSGAIRLEELSGRCLLDKPARNHHRIES